MTEGEEFTASVQVLTNTSWAVPGMVAEMAIADYYVNLTKQGFAEYYMVLPAMYSMYETRQWLSKDKVRSKQLMNPFSCKPHDGVAYRSNFKSPELKKTGSNEGIVNWKMKFNTFGFAGFYDLVIMHNTNFNKVYKTVVTFTVKSAIETFKLLQQPPTTVDMTLLELEEVKTTDFYLVCLLLNKHNRGVEGKAPYNLTLMGDPDVKAKLVVDDPLFESSTPEGYITLPIKLTQTGKKSEMSVYMRIQFDDKVVDSHNFTIYNYIISPPTGPSSILLECAMVVTPGAAVPGSFLATVNDVQGNTVANQEVELVVLSQSEIDAPLPQGMYEVKGSRSTTGPFGEAYFNQFAFVSGLPGTVSVMARLVKDPTILSESCQFPINLPFFEIDILSFNGMSPLIHQNITMNKNYLVEFKASTGLPNSMFSSTSVPIKELNINWLYYPPNQYTLRTLDPQAGIEFTF